MNTTPPTAEELATLMQSADTLRSVAEQASRAYELAKENERLKEMVARQCKLLNDASDAIGSNAHFDIAERITRMRETLKTAQEGNRNYAANVERLKHVVSGLENQLRSIADAIGSHTLSDLGGQITRMREDLTGARVRCGNYVVDIERLKRERDNWVDTTSRHLRNERYYRGLLEETAKHLGPDVFVRDDGSRSEDPLVVKVPELVGKLAVGAATLRAQNKVREALHVYLKEAI